MRLDDIPESENVEDIRGGRGRLLVGGGVGTLVIVVLGLLFGVDPRALLDVSVSNPSGAPPSAVQPDGQPIDDGQKKFVAKVLASTEEVWSDVLGSMGKQYVRPKLVLFRDQVQSACGFSSAA